MPSGSYFEKYKQKASKGFGERLTENTAEFYRRKMMQSANAKIILVDGVEHQARIANGDRLEDLEALFLPQAQIEMGQLVQFDDTNWLISATQLQGVVPKAVLKRCNYELEWTANGIHYSQFAKVQNYYTLDMYDNEAKTLMDLDVPKGGIFVYMSVNDITNTIKIGQQFVINGQAFDVTGVDNLTHTIDGRGMVKYTCDIVVSPPDKETVEKPKTEDEGGWWNWEGK